MSGKGSAPRPFEVDRKTFESNWDAIFGRKPRQVDSPVTRQDNERNEEAPAQQEKVS